MTSTVQLRKPRNAGGAQAPSSGRRIGRPKSWTEFNTRFQSFSTPINIDITPVPKMEEETVKRREPNNYRRVRPYSASILDQTDSSLSIPDQGTARPPSPRYTSFMAPNPWRNSDSKTKNIKIPDGKNTAQPGVKNSNPIRQLNNNYDETTDNYDDMKNSTKHEITGNNTPEGKCLTGKGNKLSKNENFESKVRHLSSFSDSDSVDSAVVVSGESTPYGTSSEKSPKWRHSAKESGANQGTITQNLDRKTGNLANFGNLRSDNQKVVNFNPGYHSDLGLESSDSGKLESETAVFESLRSESPKLGNLDSKNTIHKGEKSNTSEDQITGNAEKAAEHKSTASLTLSPPRIFISKGSDRVTMEFFPDDDVIRFAKSPTLELETGNYERRRIVPSPLKSCYAPVATYDDLVEYSDSENSSGDETSVYELSRSNISSHLGYEADKSAEEYQPKSAPLTRPRQSSFNGTKSQKKYDDSDVTENNDITMTENHDLTIGRNVTGSKLHKTDPTCDVTMGRCDVKSGTWPRRRVKKREDQVDPEELMEKFRKTRENHLVVFQNIYEDSRKRINEVLESLKQTMTENGYREWYPRVR